MFFFICLFMFQKKWLKFVKFKFPVETTLRFCFIQLLIPWGYTFKFPRM